MKDSIRLQQEVDSLKELLGKKEAHIVKLIARNKELVAQVEELTPKTEPKTKKSAKSKEAKGAK